MDLQTEEREKQLGNSEMGEAMERECGEERREGKERMKKEREEGELAGRNLMKGGVANSS